MKNKIFSNLSYALCATLGTLHFIFMFFPYTAAFLSGYGYRETYPVNGYRIMGLWNAGFAGVICALLQILILITAIGLLLYGVYNTLEKLDIVKLGFLPEKLCKKDFCRYGLYGYAGLNFLLMIFLIIYTATNTGSAWGVSAGLRMGAGVFVALVFGLSAVAADLFLPQILSKSGVTSSAPNVTYYCSRCGKPSSQGIKFCSECGGAIAEKVIRPTVFLCSRCGKKYEPGIKFCSECGGAIVETVPTMTIYACSACGKQSSEGVNFCTQCGGRIEKKIVEI